MLLSIPTVSDASNRLIGVRFTRKKTKISSGETDSSEIVPRTLTVRHSRSIIGMGLS